MSGAFDSLLLMLMINGLSLMDTWVGIAFWFLPLFHPETNDAQICLARDAQRQHKLSEQVYLQNSSGIEDENEETKT
jgi:hypothetical protein